jgi:hypothetical protein
MADARVLVRGKVWSGADRKESALFYEEGSGKFDFNPEK